MKISERGLALIKRFEGFSAKPYLCPAGKWTIGYGHVIPQLLRNPVINNNQTPLFSGVTEQQATELLKKDVAIAEEAVNRLVKTPLNQNQFDALVSLVFNIGAGAFEKSTLLRLLSSRRKSGSSKKEELDSVLQRNDEITKQFHRWVYGGGKRLQGLVARRKAEAELFKSPTHSSSPPCAGI